MSSKQTILAALKKATDDMSSERPAVPSDAEVFCDIPTGDLSQAFAERLKELSGETFRVPDNKTAIATLKELVGDQTICADTNLKSQLPKDFRVSWVDGSTTNQEQSTFDVVITGAAALVARTGSVILSNDHGGRRASILAPFHIVMATADQIVPALEQAFATFSPITDNSLPSQTVIISGPARTADIEKILVLGAHGSKRLAVIIVG